MDSPGPDDQQAQQAAAVLDAVLAAAQALLGCELVAYNRLTDDAFVTARTRGHLPGLHPGARAEREHLHCQLMLDGAPHAVTGLREHPQYGALALTADLGLRTYVGVPVLDEAGEPRGSLCGFDRRTVEVPPRSVDLLHRLAGILTPHTCGLHDLDAVLRRRGGHWAVDGVEEPHTGRSLAALLSPHPPSATEDAAALREDLEVLETAVQDRVVQEQAVGVLAERLAVPPVQAFAALRAPAADVPLVEVARTVVASASRTRTAGPR
ncbi:MAG: hypothetical protein JWO60_1285, partial [Frankiales bacterium]|nr:hypothetical protein [Frankiales bacterium]